MVKSLVLSAGILLASLAQPAIAQNISQPVPAMCQLDTFQQHQCFVLVAADNNLLAVAFRFQDGSSIIFAGPILSGSNGRYPMTHVSVNGREAIRVQGVCSTSQSTIICQAGQAKVIASTR